MRKTLLASTCCLLLCGCFFPADRGRALEARVDRLSSDNVELATQLKSEQTKLNATLPRIDQKIAEVSQALESLDKASHRTGADIGVQLQKTVEDVAALRGQVDTYVFKINEMEAALKKVDEDTERRLLEMKGPDAVKAAEARKKAESITRPTDKKEFLALADSQAKAGEVLLARQLYNEFLRKWPRDELAADAHFGLGEGYAAEDKCQEALFEYGKVIKEYAKAKIAPSAYLSSSDCFKRLKMTSEARLALEELIRGFPSSAAARTAKAKLIELDKKKAAPAPKKAKK